MASDASSRRFVPPTWQRWLNLPVALLFALLVLGLSVEVLPEAALAPVALLVLGGGIVLGMRAMRAGVVVDDVSVLLRGLVRTVRIPRSSLVSFTDQAGGWAVWVGDMPAMGWLDGRGREHTTRLWMFVLRSDARQIGSGALRSVREELAGVLRDAVDQANRDRK